MKRGLILVLVLVYALAGTCFAETDVPTTVKAVQEAYYEAINAEGDGDVKYNSLHENVCLMRETLIAGERPVAEMGCTMLFGDVSALSDEELLQKIDQFLEYVIDSDEDKLSALMRKFQTMSSVSGIIESTSISLEVNDMAEFVAELGLTPQTVGYVLAVLDIYDAGDEFLQFTDTGFTYSWTAAGAYKLTLAEDISINEGDESSGNRNAAMGLTVDLYVSHFNEYSKGIFVLKPDSQGNSYILWPFEPATSKKVDATFYFSLDDNGYISTIDVTGNRYTAIEEMGCRYAFSALYPQWTLSEAADYFEPLTYSVSRLATINTADYNGIEHNYNVFDDFYMYTMFVSKEYEGYKSMY